MKLIEQIKRHEGFRGKPYMCSAGKTTIGYGHNLDDNPLTEEFAEKLLVQDVFDAERDLNRNFPKSLDLDQVRRGVLINMVFNLGISRFMGFKNMMAALVAEDYEKAAEEMLHSRWAEQVGNRAIELAEQMRTGKYQI